MLTMLSTSTRITPAPTTINPPTQNEENILRINVDNPTNQNLATLVADVALKYPTSVNQNSGRNEFIKKVYSGLLVNTVFVGVWLAICSNISPIRKFVREGVTFDVVFHSTIVIALGVGCLRVLAKWTALNYILTAICVFFLGTQISYVTDFRRGLQDAISLSALGSLIIVLSVIGVWNKFDLTKISTSFGIIGLIVGVIQNIIILSVNTKHEHEDLILFVALSIHSFYFSIRLILDTQLIFGEGKSILSQQEFAYGSLLLLIDGCSIFALGRWVVFMGSVVFAL